MSFFKPLLILFPVVFLYGCAFGAKQENMVYAEVRGLTYDPALHSEVEVASVVGGEETNPLWTSEISNDAFKRAVEISLSVQGLWAQDARYQLEVQLLEVKQPLFGLDCTVITYVRYLLIDRHTGRVVMDEQVVGQHTATVGDAFVGIKRLRLANEGAGKENIAGLMRKLATLQVSDVKVSW